MLWTLNLSDPNNLLYADDAKVLPEMLTIINENDQQFKPNLEHYKHAKRFHGDDEECRLQCEPFIQALEQRLLQHPACLILYYYLLYDGTLEPTDNTIEMALILICKVG